MVVAWVHLVLEVEACIVLALAASALRAMQLTAVFAAVQVAAVLFVG
jgi:hypothetical protein